MERVRFSLFMFVEDQDKASFSSRSHRVAADIGKLEMFSAKVHLSHVSQMSWKFEVYAGKASSVLSGVGADIYHAQESALYWSG